MVNIPLEHLTDRQLHLHLIDLLDAQKADTRRLVKKMTELTQSVDDLKVAVDGVAQRFADQIAPLQQALTDAQAQVQQLIDDDVLEDSEQAAALQAKLDEASAAASEISGQVSELNAIGSAPEEPPAEEAPVEDSTGEAPPA